LFLLQSLAQIVVLILFKNFIAYLLVQSVFQLVSNFVISRKVAQHYPFLKVYKNEVIADEAKQKIYSNVKSTGLVKVGGLLVNSTDNLFLNYFSGLIQVGFLSNYVLLTGLASGLIMQVFSGLTGSIANINVTESKEKQTNTFHIVNFANFWIFGLATIGIVFLINDFILLWIGEKFVLSQNVVLALALNFYIFGMQNAVWTFKSTFGFFKQGQYLVLLTALINVIFSFIFGYFYGLFGILIATAVARLLTNAWYDPYIVFTLGLKQNPLSYLKKYITYLIVIMVSLIVLFGMDYYFPITGLIGLMWKILLCIFIPNGIIYLVFKNTIEFKNLILILKAVVAKVKIP
jgi:O-antigen/teichoic acid export membrane protein